MTPFLPSRCDSEMRFFQTPPPPPGVLKDSGAGSANNKCP